MLVLVVGRQVSETEGGADGRKEGANRCPIIVILEGEEPAALPIGLNGDTERLLQALLLPLPTLSVEDDGEMEVDLLRDFERMESR